MRNSDKLNGISSLKSTSTISDVLNAKLGVNKSSMRDNFGLLDTKDLGNVEYEEENEFKDEEIDKDENSEPSWKEKKSDSEESSDGFQKPVDFGIDKDTSMKLDKLEFKLMVGKGGKDMSGTNPNRLSLDSMPTTSRDVGMESPTRGFKMSAGYREDDFEVKKSASFMSESIDKRKEPEHHKDLKLFQESLEREFDQKRLELLENKDIRIKKLKQEIEQELKLLNENERKKMLKEHEEKLREVKLNSENELAKELEVMKKKHLEQLNSMQKEFDNDKQLRKEKFSMQISKFMKSGKSFDELDENEEKRELAVRIN